MGTETDEPWCAAHQTNHEYGVGCYFSHTEAPQPTGGVEPLSARQQIDLENTKHAVYTSIGMRLTDVQAQAMSDFLKRELAAERTAAKVEELERKISVNIDQFSSADYKAGFQNALDQIDAVDVKRLAELRKQ